MQNEYSMNIEWIKMNVKWMQNEYIMNAVERAKEMNKEWIKNEYRKNIEWIQNE